MGIFVGKNTGTIHSKGGRPVVFQGDVILPDDNGEVLIIGDVIHKGRKGPKNKKKP